jgi:hypothetical protein
MILETRPAALPEIILTPTQTQALKLAKDGDLHSNGHNGWGHKDAVVTYARNDRFKERPRKVVAATSKTVEELRELGFLRAFHQQAEAEGVTYQITMLGKIWLLKNK